MQKWQMWELEQLEADYPSQTNQELAEALGRSLCSIKNKASELGLKKDPAHLDSELCCRFKPGNKPHNKGKRHRPEGSRKTRLKKGHQTNCLPIGSIRTNAKGYQRIKVAQPNKWKYHPPCQATTT